MIFDGFGCLPNANNSYCAAGHLKLWPGFRDDWERVGVKHLLGFNEPDIAAAGEYKTPKLAVPARTFLRFIMGCPQIISEMSVRSGSALEGCRRARIFVRSATDTCQPGPRLDRIAVACEKHPVMAVVSTTELPSLTHRAAANRTSSLAT